MEKQVVNMKQHEGLLDSFIMETPTAYKEKKDDVMSFIDEKYEEVFIGKVTERLKSFVSKELQDNVSDHYSRKHLHHDSYESKYTGNGKLVVTLENHIMFLEEEIRRKNNVIDKLLQTHNFVTEKVSHKSDLKKKIVSTPSPEYISQETSELSPQFNDNNESLNKISKGNNEQSKVTKRNKEKKNKENNKLSQSDNNDSKQSYKKKNVTCIIGDSMVKNIKGWKINKSLEKDFVVVKSFSGATTDCMKDYIKPAIKQKPDRFIVHIGTNDLKSNDTASTISKNIIEFVTFCSTKSKVPVAVSSIITRSDTLKGKAESVNSILKTSCEDRNIAFLDNNNISQADLNGSKIHLNAMGSSKLATNFTEYIKKH